MQQLPILMEQLMLAGGDKLSAQFVSNSITVYEQGAGSMMKQIYFDGRQEMSK